MEEAGTTTVGAELMRAIADGPVSDLPAAVAVLDAIDPSGLESPDQVDLVRAIDVPSLLVIGDRSPVVTPEMAAALRCLNPRLRVAEVQDAGHGLPFDQPERLGEVVASFVRGLA